MKEVKICHLVGAMDCVTSPVIQEEDILIGVDGGYGQLKAWNIEPDWVVGDFDSLGYQPKGEKVTVLPVRKDETDMEFAMKLGLEQGFRHFILRGGLGGRFDHSMANVQLLFQLSKQDGMGILMGNEESMVVLPQGTIELPKEFQGYISVFALEQEAKGVTLENLSYEVTHISLFPTVPIGVSNEFLQGKSAKIQVKEGALLVIWQNKTTDEQCRGIFSSFSKN